MKRRTFIKQAGLASGMMLVSPPSGDAKTPEEYDFPLMDLHVHLTSIYTIERMMGIAKTRNVKFGILEHPADWAIKDDAGLHWFATNRFGMD